MFKDIGDHSEYDIHQQFHLQQIDQELYMYAWDSEQ